MSSPFYDQIVRDRDEQTQRHVLRAQLAAHARAGQGHSSLFARGRGLIVRVPHPRRARSAREAYS